RAGSPFHTQRYHDLPALYDARAPKETITIWCAACSTGQEPYTVAMLLRDQFPDLVRTCKFRILASDVSKAVVDRARAGCYTRIEIDRGLPAALRLRHLCQDGPYWRVDDGLRRMVQFGTVNLAVRWPPLPPIDIILPRNVMIYFDLETKRSVLAKLRRVIPALGLLDLGCAEPPNNGVD